MDTFYFFEKLTKGEYEKYSPFVYIIAKYTIETSIYLLPKSENVYFFSNWIGRKVGCLILGSEIDKEIKLKCIKIGESFITLTENEKENQWDKGEEVSIIEKEISDFIKSLSGDSKLVFRRRLKEELKNFTSNINYADYEFKKLSLFFKNTINQNLRSEILAVWLFEHYTFRILLQKFKDFQKNVVKNSIFLLFESYIQNAKKNKLSLSSNLVDILDSLVVNTDYPILLLGNITNEISSVLNIKKEHVVLASIDLVYVRKEWRDLLKQKIKESVQQEEMIWISNDIYSLQNIISEIENINVQVLSAYLSSYYSIIATIGIRKNIDYYLFDGIPAIHENNRKQETLFQKRTKENPLPMLKKKQIFAIDLLDFYPFKRKLFRNPLHNKIDFSEIIKVEILIEWVKLLSLERSIVAILNNHLFNNSNFIAERNWLKDNVQGKTLIYKQSENSSFLLLRLEKLNKGELKIQKVIESNRGVKYSDKIHFDYSPNNIKNTIALYPSQVNVDSVFVKTYSGILNNKKKPKLLEKAEGVKIKYKPFYSSVFVNRNELSSEVEKLELTLLSENKYLCLGQEKESFHLLSTNTFPLSTYLESLICLPLYTKSVFGKDFNISDKAYLFFKKRLGDFFTNELIKTISGKDEEVGKLIQQLKKLTGSLPVLNKFTLQLSFIYNQNSTKRISFVIIDYYEILKKLDIKNTALKKGAKERKRLLGSIADIITKIKQTVRFYEVEEMNLHREFDCITKENLFYYILALLNGEQYKKHFNYYLLYDIPLIPVLKNFFDWVQLGKELFDAFNYRPYVEEKLQLIELEKGQEEVLFKMRYHKRINSIVINDKIEISGLPKLTGEYKIKGKTPIELKIKELRGKYKGVLLDDKLKSKIMIELEECCNGTVKLLETLKKINLMAFIKSNILL